MPTRWDGEWRSGSRLQLLEELEHLGLDFATCLFFHPIRAEPGLVAAEIVLFGRGQIAVTAIRKLDGKGILEGALRFDGQACRGEGLEGNCSHAEAADTKRLDDHVSLVGPLGRGDGALRVGFFGA